VIANLVILANFLTILALLLLRVVVVVWEEAVVPLVRMVEGVEEAVEEEEEEEEEDKAVVWALWAGTWEATAVDITLDMLPRRPYLHLAWAGTWEAMAVDPTQPLPRRLLLRHTVAPVPVAQLLGHMDIALLQEGVGAVDMGPAQRIEVTSRLVGSRVEL